MIKLESNIKRNLKCIASQGGVYTMNIMFICKYNEAFHVLIIL